MPSGQRGPLKPQLLFHAPVSQYLNVLPLVGEGDGLGASTGNLTAGDAISGYSSGIGDASNWFLDTGIYFDDGHYLDTGIFAAAPLSEGAALSGSSGGIGISAWLLDSGVLLDDGIHYLDTSASPVLELATLAGEGDGVAGSSGLLSGGPVIAPPEDGSSGGSRVPYSRVPIWPPQRARRARPMAPTRLPRAVRGVPGKSSVPIDDEDVIVALYATGAIDLEEFAALIAA